MPDSPDSYIWTTGQVIIFVLVARGQVKKYTRQSSNPTKT